MTFEITAIPFGDEEWTKEEIVKFTEDVTNYISDKYGMSVDIDYYFN